MYIYELNSRDYLSYEVNGRKFFLKIEELFPLMDGVVKTINNKGANISYINHITYYDEGGYFKGTISPNTLYDTKEMIWFAKIYREKYPEFIF